MFIYPNVDDLNTGPVLASFVPEVIKQRMNYDQDIDQIFYLDFWLSKVETLVVSTYVGIW